jgi:hypothetical protein
MVLCSRSGIPRACIPAFLLATSRRVGVLVVTLVHPPGKVPGRAAATRSPEEREQMHGQTWLSLLSLQASTLAVKRCSGNILHSCCGQVGMPQEQHSRVGGLFQAAGIPPRAGQEGSQWPRMQSLIEQTVSSVQRTQI